jgi:uroporphyrinogen-III synthase
MGHRAIVEPLLEVERAAGLKLPEGDYAGMVATSRNALRALSEHDVPASWHRRPLFVVGRASGETARSIGFAEVVVGAGTARSLIGAIRRRIGSPAATPLLYLTGEDIAVDIAPELAATGIRLERLVAYRTSQRAALSHAAANAIERGEIDGVLLMSPRTAATFVDLVTRAALVAAARRLRYFCLSAEVAAALRTLAPDVICTPHQPSSEALLALVGSVA